MNTINLHKGASLQGVARLQIENLTYYKPMRLADIVKLMFKRHKIRTRELNPREYINVLEQRNRVSQKEQTAISFGSGIVQVAHN